MKSLAVNTIVALVIGVIILVIFVPLIFKSSKNIFTLLQEKFGFISYSKIEKALICSNIICNWGSASERAEIGCPIYSPMFKDFCYPFLIENGLYEEVCTLPSLFNIDPCSTMSIPIKVKISSEEEAKFVEDKIKEKIRTFESKIKDLDFILFDESRTEFNIIDFFFTNIIELIGRITEGFSFNYLYVFKNDLSTYKTEYRDIIFGVGFKVLREGQLKEGEYYIYSSMIQQYFLTIIQNIIGTVLTSKTPYLILYDNPLEIEINLDNLRDYLTENRYLRILNRNSATGDLKKDNFFVKFGKTIGSNSVYVSFKYYNTNENRVSICEFYLGDNDEYYCQINDGYIKFNLIPTQDAKIKKVRISYTNQAGETSYIPSNKDFCEFSQSLWSTSVLSRADLSFNYESERGYILKVESQPGYLYGAAVFDYLAWAGQPLNLNAIDKIHLCIKYHENIEGEPGFYTFISLYDFNGNKLVDCNIFDIHFGSYEKWVCKDINIRDTLYCNLNNFGEVAKIEVTGYKNYSLDELYLCKNC